MIDTNLIRKCKKGDSEARKIIYQTFATKMFAICMRMMGNKNDAKDVLHDGFIRLFEKIDTFRNEGSFEGWARRIFITSALTALRKRQIIAPVIENENTVSHIPESTPGVIASMEHNDIMRFISELPPAYRTVLNLYSIEGYSHQEIADQLGISPENSRVQLLRAKQKLAQSLIKAGILTENEI